MDNFLLTFITGLAVCAMVLTGAAANGKPGTGPSFSVLIGWFLGCRLSAFGKKRNIRLWPGCFAAGMTAGLFALRLLETKR